jgi:general secretion pathway protein G
MRPECVRRIGARLIWEVAGLLAFYIFTSHVAVDFFHDMRPVGARAQISDFLAALQNYRSDVGEFPSQAQGLRALRIDPGVRRWNGPYLRPDVPTDPWGEPYQYRVAARRLRVFSLGGGSSKGERVISSELVQ